MTTTFLVPKNNANSKLASDITAIATSLTVQSGEGARFPSTYPFNITIDNEILKVTNRSSDTMTVTRAQESTAAASHKAGANVMLNITAKAISDLNTAVNALEAAPPGHHASHENGGADELSVAGLSGLLADSQTPVDHKASHQNGGSDEISVAGLSGELADAQTPKDHASDHLGAGDPIQDATSAQKGLMTSAYAAKLDGVEAGADVTANHPPQAHKTSHQDGGADELSLAGLDGEPSTLAAHKDAATGVHGVGAGTIEHTGNKGASNGYAGLDASGDVPLAQLPDTLTDKDADKVDGQHRALTINADHNHQSTGAQGGKLDHGLALDGLGDDDHTQYLLKSLVDAKGDLIAASADNTPARLAVGSDGQLLKAASGESAGLQWVDNIITITFIINGGGSAITTGQKGHLEIPFACTILQATLLADQSGSIVIDLWKDTYANFPPTVADTITASAKPTLSSAQKSQDATLTGWTTAIAAGDVLAFNVDSCTTITRVTLSLKAKKT